MLTIKKTIILPIVVLSLLILGGSNVSAQDTDATPEERQAARQAQIETRDSDREAAQVERQAQRESKQVEIEEKRAERKAERSQKQIERIQARFDRIMDRLEAAVERIAKLSGRVESRIIKLEEKGIDLTVSRELLGIANTSIENARTAIEQVRVDAGNVITSDNPKEAFGEVKTVIKLTITEIKSAHRALVEAIKSVRANVKVNAAPEESADQDNTDTTDNSDTADDTDDTNDTGTTDNTDSTDDTDNSDSSDDTTN